MEILGSNWAQFLRLRQITGPRDEHDSFAIPMMRAEVWVQPRLSWLELITVRKTSFLDFFQNLPI